MVKKSEQGVFCKVYGKTLRNKVLEYMLEMGDLDFAVSDIEASISKPKKYQIVNEFLQERIVRKSRVVAGTQLYILNKRDIKVKLLLRSFDDCLKSSKKIIA